MIIFVENLITTRNTITLPFDPSQDISGQLCKLTIEQLCLTSNADMTLHCNLTQPYSAEYNYSGVETSKNTCIYIKSGNSIPNINETLYPMSNYVYVPSGPQDLTFRLRRVNNGFDGNDSYLFAFLISIVPAPSSIPACIFLKAYRFPLQIFYDPPQHLAGKEVTLQLDALSSFAPWRTQQVTIKDITQIHTNDNRTICIRAINSPRFNNPIKFYMPYGPFVMTINELDPTTLPHTTPTANAMTYNNWVWNYSASSNNVDAYKAFTPTTVNTWKSASTYNITTGAYTGAITTGTVTGEWIEVKPPWTGFNPRGLTFDSFNTVGSYKVLRQLTATSSWTEMTLSDLDSYTPSSGMNNNTRYRLVFTSSAIGSSNIEIANTIYTGTYNAMPRMMFTFKEV